MVILDNFQNVFIWSIYIFTKIMKLFRESLTIILKLPMILVWIFGKV